MEWTYKGKLFKEFTDEDIAGFVYVITNKKTGQKYVGKKLFWRIVRYKTKPKKRKKPSNWEDYYGSSKALKEDVSLLGAQEFEREIIHLCKTKGQMSYLEAKEQFDRGVLLRDDYYNAFIGCKIHKKHLGDLKIDD